MKLIHLTDIHLTTPGATICGRDPNANFGRALDHALGLHPDAEAIVITGDLSDWADREDYLRLKATIAALPLPVHLLIGNHDDRETFLSVFPECADPDGHVQRAVRFSHGTALLLDTWAPGTHAGRYCARRLAWLDRALIGAEGPVWIFMHHNPIPTHIGPTDRIMLLDAAAFGEVVARHRAKIGHIFFGHCHQPLAGSFHGIPVSAPRGTNHAGWASFDEPEMMAAADLPESYSVIIADGPSVTVHMIEFGYAGEIRIEGSPDYAEWNRETMAR